jgi:DNA-binding NtrC family response regulator
VPESTVSQVFSARGERGFLGEARLPASDNAGRLVFQWVPRVRGAEGDDIEYEALANSASMRRVTATVSRVASTDVPVLITGESGVGKEVVARTLHQQSKRRDRPFVKVNCAALPVELVESELFGHERGAFTGADHQTKGKFEQAHTGTIFLDEISEMAPSAQVKLLQVLQDREFPRLGADRDIRVDVRIIAASNRNLEEYVEQGGFREDVFYRLNVVHIRVPPLRERREEIPLLIQHFLAYYARQHGRAPRSLSREALEQLQAHSWPGNVRELQNVIQRFVIQDSEAALTQLTTPVWRLRRDDTDESDDASITAESVGLKELVRRAAERTEREALKQMLERVHWRRTEAAHRLRISDRTLREKIRQYGLDQVDQ